jgi:hypothetical protein
VVLAIWAEGHANHAITGKLFVSETAVPKHIGNIFAKPPLDPAFGWPSLGLTYRGVTALNEAASHVHVSRAPLAGQGLRTVVKWLSWLVRVGVPGRRSVIVEKIVKGVKR